MVVVIMNEYFGDPVVYISTSLESKVIRLFNKQQITHSALRISENYAESLNLSGYILHDLQDPRDIYTSYMILVHKDMTKGKRRLMKTFNKLLPKQYDLRCVLKMGLRHVLGKKQDNENLASVSGNTCSNKIELLYRGLDLKTGNEDKHWSQIEPSDLINLKYFRIDKIEYKNT